MADSSPPRGTGSLRRLAAGLLAQVRSRLELLGLEWQEEKLRLGRALFLIMLAMFFLQLALMLGVLWVVLVSWETPYRRAVVGGLALLSAAAAAAAWRLYRKRRETDSGTLRASIEELRKDEAALAPGEPSPPRPA